MIYQIFIFLLLLASLPLQLLIGVVILISSGFPVLYLQRRIGKDGKPFLLYKFRTMVVGAEKLQKELRHLNEAEEPAFKIHDDPRFTRIGNFLSHTGLDELPQLINVLKGEMALIGPRPLPVAEAQKLKPWQNERHTVQPGIISPWVLEGHNHKPFDRWMRSDIAYVKKKSFTYDCMLAVRTVVFLLHLFVRELGVRS